MPRRARVAHQWPRISAASRLHRRLLCEEIVEDAVGRCDDDIAAGGDGREHVGLILQRVLDRISRHLVGAVEVVRRLVREQHEARPEPLARLEEARARAEEEGLRVADVEDVESAGGGETSNRERCRAAHRLSPELRCRVAHRRGEAVRVVGHAASRRELCVAVAEEGAREETRVGACVGGSAYPVRHTERADAPVGEVRILAALVYL